VIGMLFGLQDHAPGRVGGVYDSPCSVACEWSVSTLIDAWLRVARVSNALVFFNWQLTSIKRRLPTAEQNSGEMVQLPPD